MNSIRKPGRVNVKLLVVLLVVLGVGGAGLVFGHYARKRAVAGRALEAGKAALDRQDWPEACKHLQVYLNKFPNDWDMLEQYAQAQLNVRPTTPENLGKAIGAYRQMLQVKPADDAVCDRLCELYFGVGDYLQTAYTARMRLEQDPDDASAAMWLGRSLMTQRKSSEAREALSRFLSREKNQHIIEVYAMLSDIAMESRTGNNAQEAREWLEKAVRNNPKSADAHVRRARFYSLAWKALALERAQGQARATEDLERAEALTSPDPHVQLLMAREWMTLGEYGRAAAALERLRAIGTDAPTQAGLVPADLALEVYQTAAELALRVEDKTGGAQLARRGLEELKDARRVLFLPYAVDLFLAAGEFEEGRAALHAYREAVADASRTDAAQAERLALIEGGFANAEGRFYDALVHLEGIVAAAEPKNPRTWRHLSYAYVKTGQERRALAALERYVSRVPQDSDASLELARAYQREGRWADMLKHARVAEERRPGDLQATLLRLEAVLKGGGGKVSESQLKELAAELEQIRAAQPKLVEVRLLQAMIEYGQGDNEAAIAVLEKAVEECERPEAAEMRLISLLATSGQREKAITVARAGVARGSETAAPRIALAELEWAAGQKDQAGQALHQAVEELKGDENVKARYALVRYLISDGKSEEAIGILRKLAEESPDNVQPRLQLLAMPQVQQDDRECERLIEDIRRVEKDRGIRWRYEQARLLLRNKQWMQQPGPIIDLLTKCIEGDPAWSQPTVTLGAVYELLSRNKAAEDLYRRYIEGRPDEAAVVVRLLELLERQQRFAEAAKILDRMPRAMVLSAHRTKVAIGQGDYKTAMEELRARVIEDPSDHASKILLARLLYQQNRESDARQHAEDTVEALKLLTEVQTADPDQLSAVSARVSILHAEGKDEEAVELLNAEVQRRKDFAAHLLRAEYQAASGRLDAAEQDFQKLTTFEESAADGYARLGDFYHRRGQPEKAIPALEAGLKADPGRLATRRALIAALLESKDEATHARGVQMLDAGLKELPDDPGLLALRGRALLARGTPEARDQAMSVFERVVQLDPRDVFAHLQLIKQAGEQGDVDKASQLAFRATGANPENTDLQLVRAQLESDMNNLVAARELVRTVLDAEPNNLKAINLQTRLALRAKDVDEAAALNARAKALNPRNEEVQLAGAEILRSRKEATKAIEALEAYRGTPEGLASLGTALTLADLYRDQKDYAAAEQRIEDAEKLDAGNIPAFILRMRLLADRKDFDKLLAGLSERIQRLPGEGFILMAGASILVESNAKEWLPKARPLFTSYMQRDPRNIEAYLGYALIAHAMKEMELAEQTYRTLLRIDPYNRQGLNNLAWILAKELHRLKDALELAEKGVARYPNDPNLLNTRGYIYYALEMRPQARRDFERCIELSDEMPGTKASSLFWLGKTQQALGDSDAARASWQKAHELDQGKLLSPDDREELRRLLGLATSQVAG